MDRTELFQQWDENLRVAHAAVQGGAMSLTAARMFLGTASWKERLAYRFPRLCGRLSEQARMDRIDPNNSPDAVRRRAYDELLRRVAERSTRRA